LGLEIEHRAQQIFAFEKAGDAKPPQNRPISDRLVTDICPMPVRFSGHLSDFSQPNIPGQSADPEPSS
jgi:hypothetical protein